MSTLKAVSLLGGAVVPFQFPLSGGPIGFKPRVARVQIFWPEAFRVEGFAYGQISISVTKSTTMGLTGTIIGEASDRASILQHTSSWANNMPMLATWEYHIDSDEVVFPNSLFLDSEITNVVNPYYFGVTLFGRYFTPAMLELVRGSTQVF
jgi:hypothetical protein